jgi:hypothetical protein
MWSERMTWFENEQFVMKIQNLKIRFVFPRNVKYQSCKYSLKV